VRSTTPSGNESEAASGGELGADRVAYRVAGLTVLAARFGLAGGKRGEPASGIEDASARLSRFETSSSSSPAAKVGPALDCRLLEPRVA
jgi:hypothetical protein